MSQQKPAVSSLATVSLGRSKIYLFPLRSIAYGAVSLAVVCALLLLVDRLVLGNLERAGWTAGELWARHNKLVEENHRRKTTVQPGELIHWSGQPLPTTAPGRRKILVLGDSFVWGPSYTTLNHLWWRQLAIELARRGYHDVDVLAAGNPGWSTRRQLECAERLIPKVRPDLVIWGYVTNDPDEKLVRQISESQDRPPYGERIRRQLRRVLPNLVFKFESLRADKLAAQYAGPKHGYSYFDWELELLKGENFARYCETVNDVGNLMGQTHLPMVLLTLSRWPCREHYQPRYAPVLSQWQAAGVTVHNTLDEFIHRYGNVPASGPEAIRWGINPADAHPGPRATHFHAVMAADYLEEHHPEILGPRDPTKAHDLAINDWLPFDLNVRETGEQTFELDYPASTDFMPRRPGDEPTALVALRYPLLVREIRLEGSDLAASRVWVSLLDPIEAFDEDSWRELKPPIHLVSLARQPFSRDVIRFELTGEMSGRPVAMIRFLAPSISDDRRLRLTIVPNEQIR